MEEQVIIKALQKRGFNVREGQTILGNTQSNSMALTLGPAATLKLKSHYLLFSDTNELIILPVSLLGKIMPEESFSLSFNDIERIQFKNRSFYYNLTLHLKDKKQKKIVYQVSKVILTTKWQKRNLKTILSRFT